MIFLALSLSLSSFGFRQTVGDAGKTPRKPIEPTIVAGVLNFFNIWRMSLKKWCEWTDAEWEEFVERGEG